MKEDQNFISIIVFGIFLRQRPKNESIQKTFLASIAHFFGIEIKEDIDVRSIKSKRIWNRTYLHFDFTIERPHPLMPIQSQKGFCHALSSQYWNSR